MTLGGEPEGVSGDGGGCGGCACLASDSAGELAVSSGSVLCGATIVAGGSGGDASFVVDKCRRALF